MSREARDLLKELLEPNPKRRIPLQCVLAHPWFLRNLPPGYTRLNEALLVRRWQRRAPRRDRAFIPLFSKHTQRCSAHKAGGKLSSCVALQQSPWWLRGCHSSASRSQLLTCLTTP